MFRFFRAYPRDFRAKSQDEPSALVGPELAKAVADRLDAGDVLGHMHAYYCGMGLAKDGKTYVYSSVNDGEVATPKDAEWVHGNGEAKIFASRADFIDWLSSQTDESLRGGGNQRITLDRLRGFTSNR